MSISDMATVATNAFAAVILLATVVVALVGLKMDHDRRRKQSTLEYMNSIRPRYTQLNDKLRNEFSGGSIRKDDVDRLMSNTVLRNDVRDLLGIFEITQAKLFTPVSLEHRACAKRLQANPQERLFTLPSEGVRGMMSRRDRQGLLLENAFESGIAAQVLVNDKSQVAQFNQKARELFGLTSDNQGQNLSDMGFYFRPVELQPLIQRAYSQGHDVAVENVP